MKYIFILTFMIVYTLYGKELGYTTSSGFHTHLSYMFQHSGIIHLILNSIAFFSLFHILQHRINKYLLAICIMGISCAVSFISEHDIPTIGASGMVYAMIGIYIHAYKITASRKYLKFITVVTVGLAVSLLNENSNFLLHVYSMLCGYLVIRIIGARFGLFGNQHRRAYF